MHSLPPINVEFGGRGRDHRKIKGSFRVNKYPDVVVHCFYSTQDFHFRCLFHVDIELDEKLGVGSRGGRSRQSPVVLF